MDGLPDPEMAVQRQLQDLYRRLRRPTYRALEAHADLDGRALRTSTISDLLNGPAKPRWNTVETFVRACARYARAHQIELAVDLVDLDRWQLDIVGRHREALASLTAALAAAQATGDNSTQALCWQGLGRVHHHLRENDEAAAYTRRALRHYRAGGERYHLAEALTDLGHILNALGEPIRARQAWQEALSILQELGHPDTDAVRDALRRKA